MVEVNGVVVSFDVFKEKFLCDLEGCNGACCIEGDAGAPITPEEVKDIERRSGNYLTDIKGILRVG
mgnify:CR=1 FL=1